MSEITDIRTLHVFVYKILMIPLTNNNNNNRVTLIRITENID